MTWVLDIKKVDNTSLIVGRLSQKIKFGELKFQENLKFTSTE